MYLLKAIKKEKEKDVLEKIIQKLPSSNITPKKIHIKLKLIENRMKRNSY